MGTVVDDVQNDVVDSIGNFLGRDVEVVGEDSIGDFVATVRGEIAGKRLYAAE